MSALLAGRIVAPQEAGGRNASEVLHAAWRSMDWRQWCAAAAAGALLGMGNAMYIATQAWDHTSAQLKGALLLVIGSRWSPLLMAGACLLVLGWAVLRQLEHRGPVGPRHYAAMVVVVTVVTELAVDPLAFQCAKAMHGALHVPVPGPWAGQPWVVQLLRGWALSAPTVLTLAALWTLAYVDVRSARTAGAGLRRAQIALADTQRRVLAEQLTSAQASVEPQFLFDTLSRMEACFESDRARAQQLTDALIRFLRAAMPASADAGCTLGQHGELARAWLDIVAIGAQGRLQPSVDIPASLRRRPFAPLLLQPLLVATVDNGPADAGGCVAVRAALEGPRLVLEIEDTRRAAPPPPPLLAEVGERLARLYGHRALLQAASSATGGVRVRLAIDDPGDP